MKKLIILLLLLQVYIFVNSQDSGSRLEIYSGSEKVFLGDKLPITIKIYDPNLLDYFENDNYNLSKSYMSNHKDEHAFYFTFEIEPVYTGIVKLGPIEIEYQNEKLHSNEISIQVIEKKDKDYAIFDVPTSVKCYTEEDIKIKSNTFDLSGVDLTDTKYYKVVSRSYSSSVEINNNVTQYEYVSIFRVNFICAGELELNRENLLNLPESLIIEPITIKIED